MVKEELGMIVILIGPPGSGKGTIAELIQKNIKFQLYLQEKYYVPK